MGSQIVLKQPIIRRHELSLHMIFKWWNWTDIARDYCSTSLHVHMRQFHLFMFLIEFDM